MTIHAWEEEPPVKDEETVAFQIMARFFLKVQDLLNEQRITLDVVAEIRNALYGPSVQPIDVAQLRKQQSLVAALMNRRPPEGR